MTQRSFLPLKSFKQSHLKRMLQRRIFFLKSMCVTNKKQHYSYSTSNRSKTY